MREATSSDSNFFKYLKTLWAECGYSAEDVVRRGDEVMKEIQEYIQRITLREQERKQEMHKRLDSLLCEANKLSKELDVHFYPALYETLPLCESLTKIECETKKLQEKKSALKEEILEISNKEAELCSCLGEHTEIKLQDTLPTREEIAIFHQRLHTLELRKATAYRVFQDKKSRIVAFLEQLECEPSRDFERIVVYGDDTQFKLSEGNMQKLQELEISFEKKVLDRRKYVSDLWDKLRNLWVRLQEDATYQGDFLHTNTGIGNSTVTEDRPSRKRRQVGEGSSIAKTMKSGGAVIGVQRAVPWGEPFIVGEQVKVTLEQLQRRNPRMANFSSTVGTVRKVWEDGEIRVHCQDIGETWRLRPTALTKETDKSLLQQYIAEAERRRSAGNTPARSPPNGSAEPVEEGEGEEDAVLLNK